MAPNRIPVSLKPLIALSLFALLGLQPATAASRDPDWELSKQDSAPGKAFELYQRDVAGSGYDRYRLEAVIDAPMERVIHAITLRREDDQYLGEGFERTILRREGQEAITYIKMTMPMIKDRDITMRSTRGFDEDRGVYRDEWWTANDEAPPLPRGVVRMAKSEGFWEVSPAGENRTRVVYESHADPGGRVPSWIANSILGDQVVEQIVMLRQIIDDHRTNVAAPPIGSAAIGN
jgi:hypothetical protein